MAILTNDFLTNAVLINAVLTNGFLTNGKTPLNDYIRRLFCTIQKLIISRTPETVP
jgi:hypothetical protein